MNEDNNDSQANVTLQERYRNPTFSREEVEALVKLVEKYKTIILNKSTIAAVNHAKEAAWVKIAEVFNNQGFRHTRRPDCLKTKWENLKRNAKKVSNNLMDPKFDEFSDILNPVVTLLCEAEMSSNMIDIPQEINEELKQVMAEQKIENLDNITDNYNKQESDNSDGDNEIRKMRSLNFSPQESSLLLKCVREEQGFVFSKENTKTAIQEKRKAWLRITETFNKKSPQKRSTITLQTKFCNMKRNIKGRCFKKFILNKKHKKLVEEEIKAEPQFDRKVSDVEDEDNGNDSDGGPNEVPGLNTKQSDVSPDPISTAFGTESYPDGDNDLRRNRSLNFSPDEVRILLKCARNEYQHIFCKERNTASAIHQKNKAWMRITECFNKETRQERSTRVLKTKFANLKKNMQIGPSYFKSRRKSDHEQLLQENSKNIKAEPPFEYRSDSENEMEDDGGNDLADSGRQSPDPLATVFSWDSGLGSTSFIGAYNFGNNEVTKLKIELLKYQLENAQLERQRIQDSMRAEAAARDSLATERCLRLRAARLEAVAAERKLPPTHPALHYTPDEQNAEHFVNQYQQ